MNQLITINGQLLNFDRPWVMGILNITPDSFYAGSRNNKEESIAKRAQQIVAQGADVIDIGGYSSRPGADDVTIEEEWHRVCKALQIVRREFPEAIVSIDTFRAEIARRSVEEFGTNLINDISGGTFDSEMFPTVANLNVPYILMHTSGMPQVMQERCDYSSIMDELFLYFSAKMNELRRLGVKDILVDPGFGFGKTVEQNYHILAHLADLHLLEAPILVGISRKSMIYKPLKCTPQEALNGTTVLHTAALERGASILRVHDVKEAVEAVKLQAMIGRQSCDKHQIVHIQKE